MASSVADTSPAVGTVTGTGSDRLEPLDALHKAQTNSEPPHPTVLRASPALPSLSVPSHPGWPLLPQDVGRPDVLFAGCRRLIMSDPSTGCTVGE